MKRFVRALAVLLLAALLLAAAPRGLSLPVSAASNAPLDGIDYTRLTQRASTDVSVFEVTMTLGAVDLKGLLTGTEGLTMAEINEIVLQQLAAMKLSLKEVELLSSIGDRLTREQYKQLGKKLAVALSEYIPGAPGASPTDLVKALAYGSDTLTVGGMIDGAITGAGKNMVQKQIENALSGAGSQVGQAVPKAGSGLGMVGFVLNSFSAAKDLLDDTEYDKFCKLLEEEYAKIAEFYSRCSQKLNEAMELKNFGRLGIRFDERSTAVSECVFLGVDGVRLRYTLTGVLKRNETDEVLEAGDNGGTYEGDLKLEIEGYDLAADFDAVFADKSTLWTGWNHVNDWCQILYRFEGTAATYRDNFLNKFIFTVNRPTHLKRTLVGHFTVTVPHGQIKGSVTPGLSGAFNNVSDGIDFLFRMTFGQEFKIPVKEPYTMRDLGVAIQQWHVETFLQGARAISSLRCSWVGNEAARVMMEGSVGDVMYGGSGQDILVTSTDLGTVWYMLENAPVMKIARFD